ncbi:MAG: PEP-CTERM sorting domain-containing protein [Pseudomonadota bacterium]
MKLTQLALASLALVSLSASAGVDLSSVNISAGPFTPEGLAITVDFDSAIPAGLSYTGGGIVTGSLSGHWAQPPLSTGNYITVAPDAGQTGPITIAIGGAGSTYFGMYMGSPDWYNSVTFNGSDGSSMTLSGTDLAGYASVAADGSWGTGFYFGVKSTSGTTFTSISLDSSQIAFETDNHAFIMAAVPEPETYGMLLAGLALLGLARLRKA